MAFLLQIGIDKAFRMLRNVHYFEFRGTRFKFVQAKGSGPAKYSDVLLAVVEGHRTPEEQNALSSAGNWASALAWQLHRPMAIRVLGGLSWRPNRPLRAARPNIFSFPRLPYLGEMRGFGIGRIAHTETDDQRLALTIFREAQAANNVFLTILFYWQVLEVGQAQPVGWVNKVINRRPELHSARPHIKELDLGKRRLGEYLLNDCRHAIAHLKRRPGETPVKFDNLSERMRLGASATILEDLARSYIERDLAVSESLYLVRPWHGGFPRYVHSSELRSGRYRSIS
jgi:hypothetical protein